MKEMVYGVWADELLVVLDDGWAVAALDIVESWERVATVGEAVALARESAPALRAPIEPADYLDDDPGTPFVLEECLWAGDGEWPGAPPEWSLRYLPEGSIGVRVQAVFGGEYLDIDPDDEPALLQLGSRLGWSMRRDDTLINRLGRNLT